MTSWISVVCPSIMNHHATCFFIAIVTLKKNTLFSHYCYFYFLFQRITWNPLEAHRDLCLLKGKSEVSRRRCEAMVWKLPDMHHVWLLVTTTEATVGWCCIILLTFTGGHNSYFIIWIAKFTNFKNWNAKIRCSK